MEIKDALKLNIPDDFGTDEDGIETKSMYGVFDQLDKSVITAWGISQFVIINKDWDKVIKIPFSGIYDYTDEYEFYEGDKDYDFIVYNKDCCAVSLNIYEEAEDRGIEDIFAKMEYLGESVSGTPIYTQEKILSTYCDDRHNSNEHKYSEKSYSKAKENGLSGKSSPLWRYFCLDWLAAAIDWYGEDYINKFFEFCDEYMIRDWHTANYGWREDGSPVVIDWGGYVD